MIESLPPLEALSHWCFEQEQTRFFAHRENTVWKVGSPDGQFALRKHRPGYRTPAQLESELLWMQAMGAAGLPVPTPLHTNDGSVLANVEGDTYSALTWIDALPIGSGGDLKPGLDPSQTARQLGRMMAELHDATDSWTLPDGFDRPIWKIEELLGIEPLWGRFWENPDLSRDEAELLLAARDRARADLAGRDRDLDQGLIHADLLTENVLSSGTDLWMIDFDDSAFGYRTFDIATFLMRLSDRADYPDIRAATLDGYSARRRVSADELDLFLTIRALTYPGWIISRRHEPGGIERSIRNTRMAVKFARQYLQEAS